MQDRKQLENLYAHPRDGSQWVEVEGTRVHYRRLASEDSSNPTLILIHGILDSLHSWDAWVEILLADYNIVVFDVPGFGLTYPVHIETYQRYTYAHFLKALLDSLNIKEKVYLAGNSLGGFIAWSFSYCYPELVRAFFVSSPAAYPLKLPPIPIIVANIPGLPYISRKVLRRPLYDKIARGIFHDPSLIPEINLERGFHLMTMNGASELFNRVFKDMAYFLRGYPHEIRDIEVPGMVVWGESDRMIPCLQIELWKRDNPSLQYIVMEECGHLPHGEKAQESAKLLKDFFIHSKEDS